MAAKDPVRGEVLAVLESHREGRERVEEWVAGVPTAVARCELAGGCAWM